MSFTIHAFVEKQSGATKDLSKVKCNDVIYCRKTPALLFYGLADGQGHKQHGSAGGAFALHAIAEYIHEIGLSALLEFPFPDEIPFLLTQKFRSVLSSLSQQQGYPFTEYASTLLGIAVDLISGNYMILHLGDGCAIGLHKSHSSIILSPPENTFSREYTWLTTSDHAAFHLRISFGNIQNFQRLVFLTDGATSLCYGKNLSSRARQLLADEDPHQFLNALKRTHPHDDASGIVLDIQFLPTTENTFDSNKTEYKYET